VQLITQGVFMNLRNTFRNRQIFFTLQRFGIDIVREVPAALGTIHLGNTGQLELMSSLLQNSSNILVDFISQSHLRSHVKTVLLAELSGYKLCLILLAFVNNDSVDFVAEIDIYFDQFFQVHFISQ
jgi:hypothetical protein